jgi:hypothetical protein
LLEAVGRHYSNPLAGQFACHGHLHTRSQFTAANESNKRGRSRSRQLSAAPRGDIH